MKILCSGGTIQAAITNGKSNHFRGNAIVSITRKDVMTIVSGFTFESYLFGSKTNFTITPVGSPTTIKWDDMLRVTIIFSTTFHHLLQG
jgi:hypothetical protein